MKELINNLYKINVTSFIKISDKVYKIKSDDKNYILKYIDNNNLNMIIEKLNIVKIDTIYFPILNTNNEYISKYENYSFVIYNFLEEEKTSLNDLKLKFYLNELANLHNKTYYPLKVNDSFFKDTYEYIGKLIDDKEKVIKDYMEYIENTNYKSPSEWLFLLNYPTYIKCIDEANEALEKFKNISYKKSNVRMAFTFNNFDYKHIFLKESKIIGVDNIRLSSPVYDIFYTLSVIENSNVDIKSYYLKYFKTFILEDYEKEWLYSLLYIPNLNISNDECLNIKNITNSLEYIKSSYEIIGTLKDLDFK
jgi:hypothetical protein